MDKPLNYKYFLPAGTDNRSIETRIFARLAITMETFETL